MTALFWKKPKLFPPRMRSARTPPSTFLFLLIHFSNSPETLRSPSSDLPEGRPRGRRSGASDHFIGGLFHTKVRSFRGAPSRRSGRRAVWAGYMGHPHSLSTPNASHLAAQQFPAIPAFKPFFTGCRSESRAALEPHSAGVLTAVGEFAEPVQPRNDESRTTSRSLTGKRAARHRVFSRFHRGSGLGNWQAPAVRIGSVNDALEHAN